MSDDIHGGAVEPATAAPERPGAATVAASLSRVSCFAIGVLAAVVGLLPWLLSGMRLPLQNLWAVETAPDTMPIALLPLSQYSVTLVAGLVVTGAAVVGLVARSTRRRQPRGATRMMALGMLAVQLGAAAQALIVVADGLEDSTRASLYLAALAAVVALATALGVGVFVLTARAAVPGAAVGFSVGALAVGIWLDSLLAPFGSVPTETTLWLLGIARWVPAVLIGVVLGWCGYRTAGRGLASVTGLLALWIGPAAITAVGAAAGTRILAAYPLEMLDYGIGVFRMALLIPELVLPPILVALGVAVCWRVVRRLRSRRPR